MRRKDKEITGQVIEEILSTSEVCRIAMLDGDRPYIVPLNYGYSNNALYFHSAAEGKKINLLKKNNRVCFEIEQKNEIIRGEEPCEWTTRYRSVIGYGPIEILTTDEEKKKGLDIIMAQYGKKTRNIYLEKYIAGIVMLKLTIEEISGKQSGDWGE